ncbi:MAG: phosphoribosylformylglycinamidine synthase [Deltaproteobacteria bacterium]|nr:phosphoribosylformylglycinamidine synthase [Deltaproteobacteria bacterium]
MAHRIEIAYKAGTRDVPGEKLKKRIKRDMGLDVEAKVVEAYIIDADLSNNILEILRTDAFVDPVIQEGYVNKPVPMAGDWAIEVGFKPGVTDNVGRTAKEVIESLSGHRFGEARVSMPPISISYPESSPSPI